jgi:signal transduction histidine kinase
VNVRLRLTLIYGALFLVSGAALLGITYVLVTHSTDRVLVRTTVKGEPTVIERVPRDELATPPDLPAELQAEAERAQAQATEQRRHDLNQLLMQSGIALALMTVASIGLGWVMAGRALRPLEAAYEAQRRFVANASHELRTPLTMMRTSLDVAAGKPGPVPPQVQRLEGKLREGLDRADGLLEGLLALARAQHGALPEQTTASLPGMVAAAIEHRRAAIADRAIDIQQELREAEVKGSEPLLSRMVENVIDNAIRHNEPAGWVRVDTETHGDVARLVVASGGPRLEEREVRELAQPFRRLGAERTGSENGAGLGLSIVAAIASAHGGTLELHAREHGGLRVQVELPAGGRA